MKTDLNPLEYHYKTLEKLDYFILSANIALLGWTVVNTDWLPKSNIYALAMAVFWLLIIFSIIFSIRRLLYNAKAFGLNYLFLNAGTLASEIERTALQGTFIDQQSREIIPPKKVKEDAKNQRGIEKEGKELYEKESNHSKFCADIALYCLITALILFVGIKISLLYQSPHPSPLPKGEGIATENTHQETEENNKETPKDRITSKVTNK